MPRDRRSPSFASNRLVVGAAVFISMLAGVGMFHWLSTGVTRLPPTARVSLQPGSPTDENIANLCEPLLKDNHLPACHAFVRTINAYLGRHPREKPRGLSPEERDRLKKDLGLDDTELAEVDSELFTPLDAHHLETSFLLRDAARSLELDGVPDRDRARRAFAWVVRQVQLRDPHAAPAPPLYVLSRGWGSAWERSLVFFALLDQLGIPGCLVTYPDDKGAHFWLAGAVDGEDVCLFEPRLGVPVPGPKSEEQATLLQIRRTSELLGPLTMDRDLPYDVTPAQAAKAEASPARTLSSLAPRMQRLQEWLAPTNTVHLAADPARAARAHKGGVTARAGDGGPDGTLRLLRSFLPLDEGGSDQPTPNVRPWMPRTKLYRVGLSSPDQLPAVIRDRSAQSFAREHVQDRFEHIFESFIARPDGPRDALLRGRPEQAVERLVTLHDELAGAPRPDDPKLTAATAEWCAAVEKAQAALIAAHGKVRAHDPDGPAEVRKAQDELRDLGGKEKFTPVRYLIEAGAAPPLRIEAAYLLALCKHEEAERGQALVDRQQPIDAAAVRAAWSAATDSWSRFRAEYPASLHETSARLLGARALEALGDSSAARALVQNPPAYLGPWQRRACLYRARLLKGR